ncbi:MAG: ligase-associated DNA damage response endonuclease PdeM [Gammaproteobacteria bacterium]|nr:ligase-associated DNA damage response endonuclease PdeM [Gammaproteobacteria bacterium]
MDANFCLLKGQHLRLLYQKAVYWKEEDCLIISDLHLGKSHHFSKGGVPLPKSVDTGNLLQLQSLFDVLSPSTVLFLGDLFHSEANAHVEETADFLDRYSQMEKILVEGNHDIMDTSNYERLGLKIYRGAHQKGPFSFAHEPLENDEVAERYTISGHIHPGVRLKGRARKSMTLPCFYFGKRQAILPAFGNFTGLHPIKPIKGDKVYAIVNKSIVDVSG